MHIKLGTDMQHHGSRSYLDAADDIVSLPYRELVRIGRSIERLAWPEECPRERVPEFLDHVYALASQI